MFATRVQSGFDDENKRVHGGKAPVPDRAVAGVGARNTRAAQASNRRVLGDIGNLVGVMSVRCNVKEGLLDYVITYQAGNPAHPKAHACSKVVKKEKQQTLTTTLTERSESVEHSLTSTKLKSRRVQHLMAIMQSKAGEGNLIVVYKYSLVKLLGVAELPHAGSLCTVQSNS